MSWSRAASPGAVVAAGDQITVKVLRVDEGTGKISLGLKQLQDDPWSTVATTYQVGQVRAGRVTRVVEFGAFVELAPGIEGLMPFSGTGLERDADMAKAFPIGSEVEVAVLEVDATGRRIRLSRKAVAQQREQAELREYAARPDAAPARRWGPWLTSCETPSRGIDLHPDRASLVRSGMSRQSALHIAIGLVMLSSVMSAQRPLAPVPRRVGALHAGLRSQHTRGLQHGSLSSGRTRQTGGGMAPDR